MSSIKALLAKKNMLLSQKEQAPEKAKHKQKSVTISETQRTEREKYERLDEKNQIDDYYNPNVYNAYGDQHQSKILFSYTQAAGRRGSDTTESTTKRCSSR